MRKHLITAVSTLALLSPAAFAQTSGSAGAEAEANVGVESDSQVVLPTTENSVDAGADADIGAEVDVGAEAGAEGGGLLDSVAETTGDALDATGDAIGNAVDATGEAIDNTTDAAGDMLSGAETTAETTAEGTVETGADAVVGTTTGASAEAEAATAGILETLSPDELIGKSVQSPDGDTVGEVTEIMGVPGAAQQILVTTGGFLGIGAKTVALEPSMLMFDSTTDVVVVNMTEAELKALPEFEG